MAANINDKFTRGSSGSRSTPDKLTATRSIGASSITCNSLTGWPTATAVHFCIYSVDANGKKVAGTQTDWKGIVSGATITGLVLKAGTDNGDAIGAIVEAAPTSAWVDDMVAGLIAQHTQAGAHTSLTTDTIVTSGNGTIGGTLGVTGAVTHSSTTVLTGAVSGAGYSMANMKNPYKFSVYRSGNQTMGASATKILFTNEDYDTNNNFATSTYTAPVNGFYHFSAGCQVAIGTGDFYNIVLFKNGAAWKQGAELIPAANFANGFTVSVDGQLTAGDTIEVYFTNGSASNHTLTGDPLTDYFMGHFISAT